MPLPLQGKLLRVLQDKEFEPLGSNRIVRADARIIATSADLPALVAQGRFRADLYYRLNVLTIHVPPLRERPGDIEALSYAILDKLATQREAGHGTGRGRVAAAVRLSLAGQCARAAQYAGAMP